MKKETIDMKENFVRADGVSYREAVEKCIRHYVMRGYTQFAVGFQFQRPHRQHQVRLSQPHL